MPAAAWKTLPGLTVIGITGSYGKTSAKNFLHALLSVKYNVLMTPESYNTTMGVVRTIREQLRPAIRFHCRNGSEKPGRYPGNLRSGSGPVTE